MVLLVFKMSFFTMPCLNCEHKRGHTLNLTRSRAACMLGLTNPEAENKHTEYSEHKSPSKWVVTSWACSFFDKGPSLP